MAEPLRERIKAVARDRRDAFGHVWHDFWFEPRSTAPVSLFRIAYGAVVLVWGLSFAPDLLTFYSRNGFIPEQPPGGWGLLQLWNSNVMLLLVYGLLLTSAACLIVGYKSRLAAVTLWLMMVSLQARNPYVQTGGELVLRLTGLYMMFVPGGESFSLDRWRKDKEHFWEFPKRAPWGMRLAQIQLSAIYLFTVWTKVPGRTWNDGSAVGYALQLRPYLRLPIPERILDFVPLMNLFTWATLAIELSMAILIWNRKLRPWVMLGGIALHGGIEIALKVGFFSYAMWVLYTVFIPEDTAEKLILKVRDRVRARLRRAPVAAPEPATLAAPLVSERL
ncbi:MAG TPA: HTTM domain-containing protein [Actinomycetota bacterium]|jgi:uncharacterized membrane protein YphA (DoxX/SURF4 family)|nr:HTTM domain-containing protein [Actinomycetota bacterium]